MEKQLNKTIQELKEEGLLYSMNKELENFSYMNETLGFIRNLDACKKTLEFIVQRPLEALAAEQLLFSSRSTTYHKISFGCFVLGRSCPSDKLP